MNKMGPSRAQQGGMVLVIALILLLVMTLIGISNMDSSRFEINMASSSKNRAQAFNAAEAALAIVESGLQTNRVPVEGLRNCTLNSATCYEANCVGGLCFSGTYSGGDTPYDCTLVPRAVPFWRDSALNVFETAGHYMPVSVHDVDRPVRVITEFLCFIERGDGSVFDSLNPNNGAPYFRITALAVADDGKTQVALQSTYRYNE